MGVIRAKHYGDCERFLAQSTTVRAMAVGLRSVPRSKLAHDEGTPRFEFMQAANEEFRKRDGDTGGHPMHIGAVAHALLMVLDEMEGK